MTSTKIYNKYFDKDSRGYNIIRKFHERYKDELQTIACNSFDSLLNKISVNINTVEIPKETGNEEAYIVGLIKVQCRMLIDRISMLNTSNGSTDEEGSQTAPSKAKDVIKRITEFKLRLEPNELEIFNSLIDGETREELNEEGVNTSSYDSRVKKLRSKLNSYLRELGYKYENFFPQNKIEP